MGGGRKGRVDYFLLISRSISNQKCKEFLKVEAPNVFLVYLRYFRFIRERNPLLSAFFSNYRQTLKSSQSELLNCQPQKTASPPRAAVFPYT
jgi:hypothetical protein